MKVTKTGQQRAAEARQRKPWEPSERDLEIYAACTRHERLREIGKRFGICHSRVIAIRDRVGEHRARELGDEIDGMRGRHSDTLGHVINEAFRAWDVTKARLDAIEDTSDEAAESVAGPSGSPGVSYLNTAIAALRDIRKIWAADKLPQKQHAPASQRRDDGSDGMRVAGKSQNVVFGELLEKLQARLRPPAN